MSEAKYLQILSRWLKKFQRYKVAYKNGAYHLANLFQSPETMIESFDQMPFTRHDKEAKRFSSDSLFLSTDMYYTELEEGLWLMVSELHFKKNVMMRNLYDKNLPLEYHFINIHLKATELVNKSMVNGILIKDKTWSMFKAGHSLSEYHFKNSVEKNITLYFTSAWLRNQISQNSIYKNSKLRSFFDSSNSYLILDESDDVYEELWKTMMSLAMQGVELNALSLKEIANRVLENFIAKMNREIVAENHFVLSDTDRKHIQRAEQLLNDALMSDFPGIETIARKIGISPTKLKNDFRSMHNTTLYQYFSARQMRAAHELLLKRTHTIKELASLFGYENASKFSAKFQKEMNSLPSQVSKDEPNFSLA